MIYFRRERLRQQAEAMALDLAPRIRRELSPSKLPPSGVVHIARAVIAQAAVRPCVGDATPAIGREVWARCDATST